MKKIICKILKGYFMFSKIKEFVSYAVFESFPFTEYIADAFLNWSLTQKLVNNSRNTDIFEERLRLFITVTLRSFFCIFVSGLIFTKLIKPLATALFNDCNLQFGFTHFVFLQHGGVLIKFATILHNRSFVKR